MSKPIRAAAYYRMSTMKQEDSIDRQKSQVVPYAERNGILIVGEYIDDGIAGDEIVKRKEFQRLLRDAKAGCFERILCDDKDRFGRFDSIDLGEVVAPLRRKGVLIETVAQGLTDWDSFAGRMSDAIMQEAKLIEQTALSRRILTSQLLRAKQGKNNGSRPLYGYRWESDPDRGKALVPDARKAEVVQLIFRLYDRGATLCAIQKELLNRGVASPRGQSHWTRSVILRILSNRRYTGDLTWGVHSSGKRHRFTKDGLRQTGRNERGQDRNAADAWIIRPDSHEALVEREVFERVQARLKGNRDRKTPLPGGGDFLLSRLLVCGHCGSYLTGVTEGGRRRYVCRGYLAFGKTYCKKNGVAEKPLVNFLVRLLQRTFLDPENLKQLRAEIANHEAEQSSESNLRRLRGKIDFLEQRIDQGTENILIAPKDRVVGMAAKLREWEKERDAIRAELRRVETESPVKNLEEEIAAAESLLWRLQDSLKGEDLPLLREVFRELMARIELQWIHRPCKLLTRCRLDRGVVYLRTSEGPLNMFPSAGR